MKKIVALLLVALVVAGVFAGCASKGGDKDNDTTHYVTVTDESGEAVTDKNGETVTKAVRKDGSDYVGNSEEMVDSQKIPYSTTASGSTISNSTWPFGSWDKVGIVLPKGWERVDDTYNYVKKTGSSLKVVANPANVYGDMYSTASEYADAERAGYKKNCDKYKEISFTKEKYKKGSAAMLVANVKDDQGKRYVCIYIFQEGDDIMMYTCTAKSEKEVRSSIEDVIANTCYRG